MLYSCFIVVIALTEFVSGHGFHWFIIDHRHTNISAIPIRYFESARESYTLHLAYNNVGSQLIQGMMALQEYQRGHYHGERQERYFYLLHFEMYEGPEAKLPVIRRLPRLRMYAGCPPRPTCGDREFFWTNEVRDELRNLLKGGMFHYSIFFWGSQLKDMNLREVQEYLDTLDNLEIQLRKELGVDVRFIYTTGHLPGSSDFESNNAFPIEDRRKLYRNNRIIRQFCHNFHKFLFDVAAIESHTEDGNPCFTNDKFREIVRLDPQDPNSPATYVECNATYGFPSTCYGSNGQICNRKARAFWYMMARIAGYRPYNWIILMIVGLLSCFFFLPPFIIGLSFIFYFTWGYQLMEPDPEEIAKQRLKPKIRIEDLVFPEQIFRDHWRDFASRPFAAIRRLRKRFRDREGRIKDVAGRYDDQEYSENERDYDEESEDSESEEEGEDDDDVVDDESSQDESDDDRVKRSRKREKGKGKLRDLVSSKSKSSSGRNKTKRKKRNSESTSSEDESRSESESSQTDDRTESDDDTEESESSSDRESKKRRNRRKNAAAKKKNISQRKSQQKRRKNQKNSKKSVKKKKKKTKRSSTRKKRKSKNQESSDDDDESDETSD